MVGRGGVSIFVFGCYFSTESTCCEYTSISPLKLLKITRGEKRTERLVPRLKTLILHDVLTAR